jgi:hypothetical protein
MKKFKFPKIKLKLVVGLSRYEKGKYEKAIKRNETEIKSIDYSLYTGYRRIDEQIEKIKKTGFNEESIKNVLSEDLIFLEARKKEINIEIANLKKYLSDKGYVYYEDKVL